MIYESWFWKRELINLVGEMRAWSPRSAENWNEDRWGGESNFRLERSIFYSALTVRRLIESYKITTKLERSSISLETFESKIGGPQKLMHFKGADDILKEYDMENPKRKSFSPKNLASEIMHSLTLEFYVNEDESQVSGCFVASARNNYKRLIDLPLATWTTLLDKFIDDQVSSMKIEWGDGDRSIVSIRE